MKYMPFALAAAAAALSACTASGSDTPPESTPPPQEKLCNAEAGQAFVGRKATGEIGQELMKATGARTLRWVPPRTAVTADFRPDRLTVSYSDDMVIDRVSCS